MADKIDKFRFRFINSRLDPVCGNASNTKVLPPAKIINTEQQDRNNKPQAKRGHMYPFFRTGVFCRAQRIAVFINTALAVTFSLKDLFPGADALLVIMIFFTNQAHQLQPPLGI